MPLSRDAFSNIAIAAFAIILSLSVFAGLEKYQNIQLTDRLAHTRGQLAESKNQVQTLEHELELAEQELRQEKAKNEAFARQIAEITGAVGTLQRLQGTDRELLQKYSRTYFLSENYIPDEIAQISDEYLYNQEKSQWVHALVKPYLENMIRAASSAGVDLKVVSAYRSFREQSFVSERHQVVYGKGANEFSAEQGYSEHQLGTAVDFTEQRLNDPFEGFESTKAYPWLQQNAYQYGFVLSYPEDNPYYVFEPWHWRFVGVKLAGDLHSQGRHFYDLDQEAINQYLLNIFD